MIRRAFYLTLVTFCATEVLSQACVPRDVQNVILYPNGTLHWTSHPQESCYITHFRINIYRENRTEYDLNTDDTSVDVSFLTYCESWIFTIYAMSNDAISVGHVLIARLPMPSDADLTLRTLTVSRVSGVLRLSWDLLHDQYSNCADRYRVSIDDEDSGDMTDVYVNEKFLALDFISPCVVYEFGVRAIFDNRPSEEGPLISIEYDFPPVKQAAPVLHSFTAGVTTFETSWSIESRAKNRCPLGRFYVDGGDFFNISFPLADTPTRDPVLIHTHSLEPNSLYVIRVSIGNSAGVSKAAVVGIQTLDFDPDLE